MARLHTETIPTSTLAATARVVDGFVTTQTDHQGITSSFTRAYTATGITQTATDGRGNTTTTHTDLAGRTISSTDAAGNTTTTVYDADFDQPSVVTNAQGKTACYKYDLRGRKVAEWGTAIQSPRRLVGGLAKCAAFAPKGRAADGAAASQPIQWSSEYYDAELGLVYYNYRHYNPADGRWTGMDPIQEKSKPNLYSFVGDQAVSVVDSSGLKMQDELTIDSCLDLETKVISVGFWGKTETPLHNGDTVYLRRGFTIVYTGVWKTTGYCQKKRKEFFQCFPYRVIAEFSYEGKTWKSHLTQCEYKTIYGRVEREEVSWGQAALGNGGHSDLYVESGGFDINDYQLEDGGKVEVPISQEPGTFKSKQSYTIVFDSDMSRFAWNSHRIG